MLTYLFTAVYNDGQTFAQTQEDQSLVDPKKPAIFDVINGHTGQPLKNLKEFRVTNQETGDVYTIDMQTGCFFKNTTELPIDKEYTVEGVRKPVWGIVSRFNHVTPYIFRNPKSYGEFTDDTGEHKRVIDSAGTPHIFPPTAQIFQHREWRVTEDNHFIFDDQGNRLVDNVYTVEQNADWTDREFIVGWEAKSAVGTVIKRTIVL